MSKVALRIFACSVWVLLSFGLTMVGGQAASSDSPIKGDWDESGANVGGSWNQDPETGAWTQLPIGIPSDPYRYKYKLLCRNDPVLDGSNCTGPEVACGDGDGGRSVNWYRSLKDFDPPVWSFFEGPTCIYDAKPEDILDRIAAMIQSEFQKLPVAAGTVTAQPSPHTLRGAETNFFADSAEQQFDITILAQKVHVVATPVQYTWNYGDGTTFGPQQSAGGPLPQDRWGEKTRTSHVYTQTGDYQVVLTTHFQGTYSVNNGPPLPIPGQGQFSSPPQTISVWRSITRNYADDCIANPQGQGCPGVTAPAP